MKQYKNGISHMDMISFKGKRIHKGFLEIPVDFCLFLCLFSPHYVHRLEVYPTFHLFLSPSHVNGVCVKEPHYLLIMLIRCCWSVTACLKFFFSRAARPVIDHLPPVPEMVS